MVVWVADGDRDDHGGWPAGGWRFEVEDVLLRAVVATGDLARLLLGGDLEARVLPTTGTQSTVTSVWPFFATVGTTLV